MMQESTLKDILSFKLNASFEELESIWNQIGYIGNEKEQQTQLVTEKLQQTILSIIQEENRTRIELETKIELKKQEISDMCSKLSLQPYFPPKGYSIYGLLQVLDLKANELENIKHNRCSQFKELNKQIKMICERLSLNNINIVKDISETEVPNEQSLEQLIKQHTNLQQQYHQALREFQELREDVLRISIEIEYEPNGDFETLVFNDPDTVVLVNSTFENLQHWRLRLVKQKAMLVGTCDELRSSLNDMWYRLKISELEQSKFMVQATGYTSSTFNRLKAETDRCQQIKNEQMSFYIKNLKEEAMEIYSKCFIDVDNINELSTDELEQKVDLIKRQYEKNKALYEAVMQYKTMWEQYLEVEVKIKDPATLCNRGGVLLKAEKEKKRLLKELPRVAQEVAETINHFEINSNSKFLIDGREFVDYVEYLKCELKQKDVYKSRRSLVPPMDAAASLAIMSPKRKLIK